MEGFLECVQKSWSKPSNKSHSSAIIADKLKTLRQDLKRWQTSFSKMKLLISSCNKVILLLDNLEELRPLFRQEFNFRKIVKLHLENLLRTQFLYWKKRCMIWSAFKGRMGVSIGIVMGFDLSVLLQHVPGLEVLTKPFTIEEMDLVVKHMPIDKAPGPDGFNGLFFKKCWHIIKHEFYALAQDFYDGKASLENINESFITLIPKKLSPEVVGDYMPISLTGMGIKFLSKMYADDTLIVVPADEAQLLALKKMLLVFSQSTGLEFAYCSWYSEATAHNSKAVLVEKK
ncbi:uncharacterized protein [Aegilops tauschii subsp. strangulata]|uniref:uncharacterized protein n=1 Tax=Aegilops tauschii subsp. strangulata TaxID=200361 RepID=UPI003CC8AA13